jgi:uncharacterized protein YgbK (DUF1537 family)
MTENELLRDEFRTIKQMHTESISKISELCIEVRALVVGLSHAQKDHDSLQSQVEEIKQEVTELRLDSARNEPILEIAKSMYRNQILTIGGAIAAVAGTNVPWSKLFGN